MGNNTIHGAYHKLFEEEQNRIIEEYRKRNIDIKKLEASAITALRSQKLTISDAESKKILAMLRGVKI